MAGLEEWFKQDWVDIGAKKKGGGFKKCGKKDGGRINFRGGGICKKGMNKKILRK